MKFGALQFIHLLWLIPGLILFYIYTENKKKKALAAFASLEMLKTLIPSLSKQKQIFKKILLSLGLFFMLFALLRPKWGYHWEDIKRKGVDIFIALDVSKSMLAEDIKPNRLDRAKREIKDLIKILKGDRIGLIPFAGTAFVSCPLTLDYSTARLFLDDIELGTIPLGGTNLGKAIKKASQSFTGKDKNYKVIIIISDGEEHNQNALQAVKLAKKEGIKIYSVGIGTKEGAPLPTLGKEGQKSFLKDREGKLVLSKLNETILQKIALLSGGAYVRASYGNLSLEEIYNKKINKLKKKELHSTKRKRYEERFQIFLLIALILLSSEILISERKSLGNLKA